MKNRHGHCGVFSVLCEAGHEIRWNSSSIRSGKYTVNLRAVHAFVSTGLTESQYTAFCEAAKIGHVEEKTIKTVNTKLGYKATVGDVFSCSISSARAEVVAGQEYQRAGGDVIITDARHDSGRNAQHTTVSALSYTNKKVVGIVNWSKADLNSAVLREVPMTQELVNRTIEQGGKGVKKAIKKVAAGNKRDEGKTWFSELSDKVKATKTHIYYAMKNNDGTALGLQAYILNIVQHYQGIHNECNADSRCRIEGYVCSKKTLTNPKAIEAFEGAIKKTTIFKNAADYVRCRDTFWIESLHHSMLIYAPKRIHFGDDSYETRMQLAVLDWNENVLREATSLQYYQTARQPDRVAPHRVLTSKTFAFRDAIWKAFYSALP